MKILNKKYRILNSKKGENSSVELTSLPKIWCMFGALPDEVIEYIRANQKEEVSRFTGDLLTHPTTKLPYIKPIKGKNKGDLYIFNEDTGNWDTEHQVYYGKAIVLSYEDWKNLK